MVGIEKRTKKCHCVAIFTHDTHTLTNVHSSGETMSERRSKTRSGMDGGSKRDQRWEYIPYRKSLKCQKWEEGSSSARVIG